MSRIVRKPDFRLCENKGADQLRSNCEADGYIHTMLFAKNIDCGYMLELPQSSR